MQGVKKSSSGRCIKTPKHLLSTSSDEDEPLPKRSSIMEEVDLEIRKEELRTILKNLQEKKMSTSTSEPPTKTPITTQLPDVKGKKFLLSSNPLAADDADHFPEKLKADEKKMSKIIKIQEYLSSFTGNEIIGRMKAFDEKLTNLTNHITNYQEVTMHKIEQILEQNKNIMDQNKQIADKMQTIVNQLEELTNKERSSGVYRRY